MPASHAGVDYALLRRVVRVHSHNVLDPSRNYAFDTRLARVWRSMGMSSLEELVEHLRNGHDAALELAVADAMTVNETSFFRDGRPFELLRAQLLPELIEARRSVRTLRLWSGACSTGQEAYSLALLLREHFPHLANWKIRVEGTDICQHVVDRAEAGRYQPMEVNRGLADRLLVRYFDQEGEDWIVKPAVRELCHFQRADLCDLPLPLRGRFDVILLRNVILYFAPEYRREVLEEAHRLLAPDGVLFLGASEQPADMSLWTAIVAGGTCYFRPRAVTGQDAPKS